MTNAPPREGRRRVLRRRRPLLALAAALASGILADRLWGLPPALAACAAAGGLALAAAAWRGGARRRAACWLLMGVAALGALDHGLRGRPRPGLLDALAAPGAGRPVLLRGFVAAPPDPRAGQETQGWRFVVAVCQALAPGDGGGWRPAAGMVEATLPFGPEPEPGAGVELAGRLVALRRPGNPGEADRAAYLRSRGIVARLALKHPGQLRECPAAGRPGWFSFIPRLRQGAARLIERHFSPRQAGTVKNILLGFSAGLDPRLREAFAASGTIHYLAISGSHLAVVVGACWLVCAALPLGPRAQAALIILAALFYSALGGWGAPVRRSLVMAAAYFGARFFRRRPDGVQAFALAAAALLLCRPAELFDLSCLLSFGAVFGIMALLAAGASGARAARAPRGRLAAGAELGLWHLRVTLGAWLGTALPIARAFGRLSPVALAVNLPALPLVTVAVSGGLFFLAAAAVSPFLGALAAWPVGLALDAFGALASWAASLPGGWFRVPAPPLFLAVPLYGLLLLAAQRLVRWPPRRLALAAGLLLAPWTWSAAAGAGGEGEFRLTFLDVGHGLAAVAETPEGAVLVVDAGGDAFADAGAQAVLPFLEARGRRRLDLLAVTHFDRDHVAGLPRLVERRLPLRLGAAAAALGELAGRPLERLLRGGPGVFLALAAGDRFRLDSQTVLTVLHPPAPGAGPPGVVWTGNECSLALLLECRGRRFLLTGDAGPQACAWLGQSAGRVDAIQLPHHGREPAGWELAAATQAALAVASDDEQRRPPPGWRGRARICNTCVCGAISLVVDREGRLRVEYFLDGEDG